MIAGRRVVLFTPGLWEAGGAAKHARTIVTQLVERGWEVRVIARVGSARVPRLRRTAGLTVLEVPGFGVRLIGGALYLATAIPVGMIWAKRGAPCVAMQLTSPATAAAISATLRGGRVIGLLFSSGAGGELEFMRQSVAWPIRRRLLRRADCLIGQTAFAERELATALPGVPTAVVPTPVEPVEPPALTGAPRALFSGRLTAGKGLDCLLEAWKAVVAEEPKARLVIAGTGSGWGGHWRAIDEELREQVSADERLSETVQLTGWVDDMPALLRSTDVYAYPSLSEGMSNALLEACASGRVVVASDIAPNRAVLGGDYPLLFPVGDSAALTRALIDALMRDEVRERARALVTERTRPFHVQPVIDRLEGLITDGPRT